MTIGTLADLVAIDGMPCLPTLRRFIAADPCFPVIQRAQGGTPYRLDLEAAASYVRAHWRDRRRALPADEPACSASGGNDAQAAWIGLRIGTLAELGAEDGMPSLPSLQRFIATNADFPILQRGRNGLPYMLDLDAAASFVRASWRDGRRGTPEQDRKKRDAQSRQQSLPGFEPLDGKDPTP